MKKIYYLFLLSLFYSIRMLSNNPLVGFIENRGQIHDQNFEPNLDVKYLLSIPDVNVQLRKNSFSYDTYTIETRESQSQKLILPKQLNRPKTESVYHFHRVDVEFIGANPSPEIFNENPSETYFNYYTSGTNTQGAIGVRSFSKITYKNLYPNIDLEFIANDQKIKYNFILHYGADVSQIKWKYKGSENTELKNNSISINVKHGVLDETIPESFINTNSRKSQNVDISFEKLDNDTYGFSTLENIKLKPNQVLVIDPTLSLLWATYFGGVKTEFISSSCIDSAGDTYYMGTTSSVSSIATAGAYQITYGGGAFDAMLFKFNTSGVLQWATYFGGNLLDDGYGIVIDKSNNLFVCGITGGSPTFTTTGAHQTIFGGGLTDAFLAKFTNSGTLIWSTYYGGTGREYSFSCQLDTIGNIYLGGITSSTNAISTTGSYQVSYGGGTYDGFLAKFNTNGVRQWGTYYGGTNEDAPQYCKVDKNNAVYLGGYSTSSLSISTLGSHQSGYGGGWDAFLVKFSPNGSRLWGTYYGGSGDEYVYNINCDSLNNVYITGPTTSVDSISTLGSHQPIYGGAGVGNSGDAFLVKFDSSGVRQWGTYYGGGNDDGGSGIAFKGPFVYLSGGTQSPTQISTPNTFQDFLSSGFAEMFLAKFDMAGIRQWGTYLGGGANDICYFMLIDQIGAIYLCGTSDGSFPVTSGAYQTTLAGMIEGIIVKFRESAISTGITEFTSENNYLSLFPNPNKGSFTIQTKEDAILNVVNELGQIVKTIKLDQNNNHKSSIQNLTTGIYFIGDSFGKNLGKVVVIK